MIDPSSSIVEKKYFLPLNKSIPDLNSKSSRMKRALVKQKLKMKESYWSNDMTVQYIPFK